MKSGSLLACTALALAVFSQACKKADSSSSSNLCNAPAFLYRDSAVTIVLPNAFTPNGDGRNDLFHSISANNSSFANYSLIVYNQGGGIEFQTTTPGAAWQPAMLTSLSMATYRYSASLHFTSPAGRTIDTCIAVYRLPLINGCNTIPDTADARKFVFEDQVDIATCQTPYPTGDNICLLQQ